MISAFRIPRSALRALWVALLALAFVWQPDLLAAGEAHGSAHVLADGHAHGPGHGHDDHHDHNDDAPSAPHDEDPWRGLLHVVQCCGALCVMPGDLPALALAVPASLAPPMALADRSSPLLAHPLRPPILG